ncbi:glycosyltransferase family 4 protein [Blastococcus deserti]|uniref:Glycosyltransferase family 4 protein n=1 Tax=Blastococcus deserti TaxID=2259033 RepID=A0ABW4XEV6_9ACTN
MKPRICLYTDSTAPSGVGQHMLTLAEELQDGFTLSLVCPPSPTGSRLLGRARALGIRTAEIPVGRADSDALLAAFLRDAHVELFHCHAGVMIEGYAGVRAARGAGVPAVVRTEHLAEPSTVFPVEELPDLVHSPYHRPDRRLSDAELAALVTGFQKEYLDVVELVDRVICVSEGVRDSYLRVGVDQAKLRVVRNGIRPTRGAATPQDVRARLHLPPERRIVLSVGRMVDVKGHRFVLGAVDKVVRSRPEAAFVWVGSGPLERELRERVRLMGLEDWVWFAGERSDVPDLMAAADVFLLASAVEGLPLVVLEAMAAALPVVATRVPGTSEVVVDGVTGRLVERGRLDGTGDIDALATAILQPLEDPELASAWGRAGLARVQHEFTSERMAQQTAEVYAELLR